ncbi:aldehyde dehydrogenase (NADP(+)) [Gallaecimonas xiamenensis]|uniref:Aldehyde dehydrogenase n=1 Tax=Gallaecimonas xiamenensis 3-C-1 TaxID=745411 RepID=K2K4F8_9GAMM|nr:aldehyde dehydrogenase (NADP(+)) [Gallaecimonas xiamenensis]EKE72330.1 aldehyde dehydrogenase [Gallaecimonas xiamenensis 3-C-1]
MSITGKQLINGEWVEGKGGQYQGVNPATGQSIEPALTYADGEQVKAAAAAAKAAAPVFAATSLKERGAFLERCSDEIMALGDDLLERLMAETGYPRARVEGERGRTCGQLKLFASTIQNGEYLDARIDLAMPERQPLPRPDIRFYKQPIGPVVVFGASNFPLAFSVAGGDTASALAAGCPVIVKGHNSHPGSGELVAQALAKAVKACGLPAGTFSFVTGPGRDVGAALVTAPEVKAVGFTGSMAGGMALFNLANQRPEPIPVFAEMGSVNPVVVLPQALKANAAAIAEGFVGSLTLGVGQFCVNPGLVLGIKGAELDAFMDSASAKLAQVPAGVMLNEGIASSYGKGAEHLAGQQGVVVAAKGQQQEGNGFCGQAQLLKVDAKDFIANAQLQEEVFGPSSVVVQCQDAAELLAAVACLKGQLSGTLQANADELRDYPELLTLLQEKVGRLVFNNFPTGVEVCHAMMHGGPFPAATDARFTSVGTKAIDRFVRPICFQNYPQALLPAALLDNNPWGISRWVNGERSNGVIGG